MKNPFFDWKQTALYFLIVVCLVLLEISDKLIDWLLK